MSEPNKLLQEEVDLAAMLAIDTEKKDKVLPKLPEAPEMPNPVSPAIEAPESTVAVADIIPPDEAAANMVNMIDALQSIILTGVITAKQYFHFSKEDREIIKLASKKSVGERSAYETMLLEQKKVVFQKYQAKCDKLEFTDKEMDRLRKPAKAFVVQKNIQVSPGLAFGIMIADILTDRAIDILMDD